MDTRSIIKLGRGYAITIPIKFMNILNLKKGDKVGVYLYEGLVVVRPLDSKENELIRRLEDGRENRSQNNDTCSQK